MLRAPRTIALSILAILAALPPAAGAMAGDASEAPAGQATENPPPSPPPAKAEPDPPPPPAPEQRVEPRQERFERQQERVRDEPDRAQERQQRQQEREDRLRQKQEAEQEREQRQQEAERARAEREQQKQEAERARAEREQQKEEAERARQESEQKKPELQPPQDAQRPDSAVPDRENAGANPEPARQTRPERDADRAGQRDGERRRPERRETPEQNPSAANPPPSPDSAPAGTPPPARKADDKPRRPDRDTSPVVGNPPVERPTVGTPAGGAQPDEAAPPPRGVASPPNDVPPAAIPAAGEGPGTQRPPVREESRRAVGRDVVRESYRRAPRQQRSFEDLRRNRRERVLSQGNLRVIEEPDRRVIVKQNDRTFIRHDESERFRRIAPDARTIRRSDGTSTTFITRSGGVRIYDVTDRNGRLLQRYRRYPNGREVILIDNRGHYRRDKSRTRDVLIGAGIGLVIGSAIALSAPKVRIPRDEYIVDYGRASDDDLYDALTAPPIERLDRGYSLDEVRYSRHLRDRMRRIDLDTVTFDFGSWEVGPDQGRALDRLADGINRVLQKNPEEIFMIEGHTDAVGSQEDNLTLSDRRAQSVAEILTTEYGVAPENLVTQGYGEEQLKIATNGPERLNRRITVRRIGPLLSGRFEEERYSGARRVNDRSGDRDRDYEDLDDSLPAVVPPDDGRAYDYDRDRYYDRR